MKQTHLYFPIILILLTSVLVSAQAQNPTVVQPISLEEALKIAPDKGKKILVDVYASWCPYCKRMHSEVYPSNMVQKAISEYFIWVKINVESSDMVNYHGTEMTEAEFAQALGNKNIPTSYFLNDEGAIVGVQPGFLNEKVFSNLLNFVGSDAYLTQSFSEYVRED